MGSWYGCDRVLTCAWLGLCYGCSGAVKWVWWGHGVLTVCSVYHGAMESLVLWSHDIAAAVLWIMINECQVYNLGTIGHHINVVWWSNCCCLKVIVHPRITIWVPQGHCVCMWVFIRVSWGHHKRFLSYVLSIQGVSNRSHKVVTRYSHHVSVLEFSCKCLKDSVVIRVSMNTVGL